MRRALNLLWAPALACATSSAPASAPALAPTPPAASEAPVDPAEHLLLDATGDATTLTAFVANSASADLVAFGEFHGHPVGARYELDLLEAMADQDRPVALAMEFFEADTQESLDAYLAGEIDEAQFETETERNEAYASSHRPLIELCKARGIPVIAANAPRDLVTAYRKSELQYAEYLGSLTETERGDLPATTEITDDEFTERFLEFMGSKRGPAFLPAMALWNDAMAESMAEFRDNHPDHRILFIVGGFHVAKHLGTITRYLARRTDDAVKVVLMVEAESGPMSLADDDRGEGDLLLLVRPTEQ